MAQTNIPEILEWGHSRNFEPKILTTGMYYASQIVSHTIRVWRLHKHAEFNWNKEGMTEDYLVIYCILLAGLIMKELSAKMTQ